MGMRASLHELWVSTLVLLAALTSPLNAADDKPELLITVSKGTLPIILSSPHGGQKTIPGVPPRKGEGTAQFVTVLDGNTAELTEKIADAIEKETGHRPYVVIARFGRKYVDANRPAAGAYEHPDAKVQYDAFHKALQDATAEVKTKWGRGLLLDIHGQGVTAGAIYRGTRDGTSVAELMKREGQTAVTGPKSILGQLAAAGYTILPVSTDKELGKEARFNGGYITNTYGSQHGGVIDAVQMEFGGTLRKKDQLPKVAADVAKAIKVFAETYLPKTQKENAHQ